MANLITQAIGFLAYIVITFSYWKKEKIEILFIQIFSTILFAIHYFLLDGLTGTICNILSVVILIYMYFLEKKKIKSNWSILVIFIIFILIGYFTYQDIFSLFPIVGSILPLSSFLSSKENIIRICGVLANICWIIYAIIFKSYSGVICEIITAITTLIAIFKIGKNSKYIMKKKRLYQK